MLDKIVSSLYLVRMAFSNHLKEHRKRFGLSQVQLAKLAGCHPNTVRWVEKGTVVPTLTIAAKIASAMGLTIGDVWPMEEEGR